MTRQLILLPLKSRKGYIYVFTKPHFKRSA